ncbi:hypothetical protein ACTFIU_001942 [Dictyostelium citrinum]
MKISNSLILGLLLVSLCILSNAQMFGKKCKLPPIPPVLDSGSQSVVLVAELFENDKVSSKYNKTFSKGTGASFFSDSNNVSVYNSGENLYVEYKLTTAMSGTFYNENCTNKDIIPTGTNSVRSYYGGFAILGSKYTYNYKFTVNKI